MTDPILAELVRRVAALERGSRRHDGQETKLPRVRGTHVRTSDVQNVSGETQIFTVTVTVPAGRELEILWNVEVQSDTAGSTSRCQVYEDGAKISESHVYHPIAGGAATGAHYRTVRVKPAAGSHTYRVDLARAAGSGTVTARCRAQAPGELVVRDIGPA